MKVLIACEYSGAVRDAFIRAGHEAMSCDLLPTDVPGPHYQGDVRDVLHLSWDLLIAHPPTMHFSEFQRPALEQAQPGAAHADRRRLEVCSHVH